MMPNDAGCLKLVQVRVGWAAVGDSWAVFGATQEEAIERFGEAEERHKRLDSQDFAKEPEGELLGQ